MATFTIGDGGYFATITQALASGRVAPGDTLAFLSGYTTENASVGIENLTFSGDASNTGIALTLDSGILDVTLTGTAPIAVTGNGWNNSITGNDGSNMLAGAAGNDTFNPGDSISPLDGLWGDFMIGGAGNDIFNGGDNPLATVVYAMEGGGAGVSVDLGTGIATDTFGDTDTLNNIRVVVGTLGNDYLAGGSSDETFYPGLGTDTINGGSGFDVLSFDSLNRFFIDREFLNLFPEFAWWDYGGVLGGIAVQFDSEGAGTVFGTSCGCAVDANKVYLDYGGSSFTFTGIEKVVGTGGYDAAVFSGLYAAYTISTDEDQLIVEGPDGRHLLSGFERLQFADGIVTLPISGEPINHAPFLATAIPDQSSPEDAAWNFTLPANTFTDIDGDTLSYSASLINGPIALPEWPLPQWLTFNPRTQTFAGTPPLDFNGSLDLKVTASDGLLSTWDSFRLTITPVNDPPTVAPVAMVDTYSTNEDQALIIGAAGVLLNDTDADNDPLTAVLVSGVQHGTLALYADGSLIYEPAHNYNGLDSFTYKANDGQADSNVVTVSLTVNPVNDAPVAVDDSYITNEDTTLTVAAASLLANDSDADGDALTVSLVSNPAHGEVLSADGTFSYTPEANYNGADSFTYKLNDGQADSNVATVSLTVTNVAPFTNNDSYAVTEHKVLTVNAAAGVLANDSDVDGDPLYAALVSGPAHGKLTLNSDGSFVYKPLGHYNGPDSFTYKAFDGSASSDLTTVSITVNAVNQSLAIRDFNAEANSDILRQHDSDSPAIWTMDGTTLTGGAVPSNPGSDWHVAAAADWHLV
jgi:VCBS repeat-containing protein